MFDLLCGKGEPPPQALPKHQMRTRRLEKSRREGEVLVLNDVRLRATKQKLARPAQLPYARQAPKYLYPFLSANSDRL
jgi:hypothetical protein